MTPEQKAAIVAKLSVNLATLDSDRLIELCLLHRAQPKALETFPNALAAEIDRRFTAAEIARDDVTYSVLQHFANQFTGAVPLFQRLMQEMAASVNRDIWFTDNAEAFKAGLNNEETAAWLARGTYLSKCLQNRLALSYIAQSTTAATAILTDAGALMMWKNAPALWDIWPQHAAGMQVLAKSGELIDYLFSTPAAVTAVQKQPAAMKILIAQPKGRRHMATAAFMKTIVTDESMRNAFIADNDLFQSVRSELYKAVSAAGSGWVRAQSAAAQTSSINSFGNYFPTPAGLLFTRFTRSGYNAQANSKTTMKHPGGSFAAAGQDNSVTGQGSLNVVDGISFNGATFEYTDNSNYAYGELWKPQG